jgi:hypothetical protein
LHLQKYQNISLFSPSPSASQARNPESRFVPELREGGFSFEDFVPPCAGLFCGFSFFFTAGLMIELLFLISKQGDRETMRAPSVRAFFSSFRAPVVDVPLVKERGIAEMFEESALRIQNNFSIFRVVYLAFCFLLLFVGFGAPQALLTVLFPAGGVGFNSLIILYFVFAASSIFAPLLSRLHFDPKWSMFVCSLTYVFFVGAMLTQLDWMLYLASVLIGIGAAGLWVSEGIWVARARCNEQGHNTFWVIFTLSSIVSNLLSGKNSKQKSLYFLIGLLFVLDLEKLKVVC